MLIKIKGYKDFIWTNAVKAEFEKDHIDVILYDTVVIRIPKKMIDRYAIHETIDNLTKKVEKEN